LKKASRISNNNLNSTVAGFISGMNQPLSVANPVQTMALDAFRGQTVDDQIIAI
jgi:hypothetical protein